MTRSPSSISGWSAPHDPTRMKVGSLGDRQDLRHHDLDVVRADARSTRPRPAGPRYVPVADANSRCRCSSSMESKRDGDPRGPIGVAGEEDVLGQLTRAESDVVLPFAGGDCDAGVRVRQELAPACAPRSSGVSLRPRIGVRFRERQAVPRTHGPIGARAWRVREPFGAGPGAVRGGDRGRARRCRVASAGAHAQRRGRPRVVRSRDGGPVSDGLEPGDDPLPERPLRAVPAGERHRDGQERDEGEGAGTGGGRVESHATAERRPERVPVHVRARERGRVRARRRSSRIAEVADELDVGGIRRRRARPRRDAPGRRSR